MHADVYVNIGLRSDVFFFIFFQLKKNEKLREELRRSADLADMETAENIVFRYKPKH